MPAVFQKFLDLNEYHLLRYIIPKIYVSLGILSTIFQEFLMGPTKTEQIMCHWFKCFVIRRMPAVPIGVASAKI